MRRHSICELLKLLLLVLVILAMMTSLILAADGGSSSEYLKYQEPKAPGISWLSSISYIFSLLVTFGVVIALAYFSSRFLGQKMGKMPLGVNTQQILFTVPLGANRALYAVEVANKVLVLGVTDQSIVLLQELHSPEELAALKSQAVSAETASFETVFQNHLASLKQMTQKFPVGFDSRLQHTQNQEREKR